MEIYLIRHTETIAEKDMCYGQSDLSLKEPFLQEYERIRSQINVEESIIYTSPLRRCINLALFISKGRYKIICDNKLKELNFGQWELKKWNDIDPTSLNEWTNDFVNCTVPEGESFTQLYQRVNNFIENILLKNHEKKSVIIVTHAGVIRCFLCREQNIPLKDAFSLEVN